MNTRSTRSTVKFFHPFNLKGQSETLPAGDYDILVEEELLQVSTAEQNQSNGRSKSRPLAAHA